MLWRGMAGISFKESRLVGYGGCFEVWVDIYVNREPTAPVPRH